MQQAKAVARTVRIAPRKARLVMDLIRGKQVGEAVSILNHTPKAASPIIEKVLKSAIANAEHNYEMDANNLVVTQAYVNEGPTLKRFRPRCRFERHDYRGHALRREKPCYPGINGIP